MRDQQSDAQYLYDDRATGYDNSWHPRFARHMVELAKLQPGEYVLDLACGTGLVTSVASTAVGRTGRVIGVDVSRGMLAQALAKEAAHAFTDVAFYQHSITNLRALPQLDGTLFDVIICASALVLLQSPGDAIKQWVSYLKPGGRLVADVTHPESQISLITFERVGRTLERPVPFYRVPFEGPEDLRALMKHAGLHDIEVKFMSQMDITGTDALEAYVSHLERPRIENRYRVADADRMFEKHIGNWAAQDLAGSDIVQEARRLFRAEWARLANADGIIEEVDGIFVDIGRRPPY